MAENLLKRGKDSLSNGIVAGGLVGLLLIYAETITTWLMDVIPITWIETFPEGYGFGVIVVAIGALLGYIIDRQ